jgi:hypothetical protein
VFPAFLAADLICIVGVAPARSCWLVRIVVATGAGPALLFGSTYLSDQGGAGTREWSSGQALLVLGGMAVGLATMWTALEETRLRRGASTTVAGLALALALVGASGTIMLSGSATAGLLGLPLAAAVLGVLVAGLARQADGRRDGPVGPGLGGLFALLVMGRFFASLSTTHALLLFSAPGLGVMVHSLGSRRAGPKTRSSASLLAVGLVVAGIVVSSAATFSSGWKIPSSWPAGSQGEGEGARLGQGSGWFEVPESLAVPPDLDQPVSP